MKSTAGVTSSTRSVTYPVKLFSLRFPIYTVKLACLLDIEKNSIHDNKMTKFNIEKWKNSLLEKKKSFIGSATRVCVSF